MGELKLLPSAPAGRTSPTTNTSRRAPASYRYPPLRLFVTDIMLALRNLPYIFNIILPFFTTNPKGELYLQSRGNIFSIFIHTLLIIIGLAAFPLVVLFLIFPGAVWLGWVLALVLVVAGLSWLLNGNLEEVELKSCGQYVDRGITGEKWIFINGVMAGKWWTQCAVDELERRFCREVTGIHNRTFGLILDLIQCMIQRDLGYSSRCVRDTYFGIRTALLQRTPKDSAYQNSKVVVIAHSQGGLILSLALDMLYSDLADDLLSRLEVFTFGCAANHFNNPPNTYPPKTPGGSFTRTPTVKHIEHYANEYDFVSRFGVLAYRPSTDATPPDSGAGLSRKDSVSASVPARFRNLGASAGNGDGANQFSGKIFLRKGGSGHQFCQHYLPLFDGTGEVEGQDDNGEAVFLERSMANGDQNGRGSNETTNGLASDNGANLWGVNKGANGRRDVINLADISRLWGYRGGKVQK